MAEPQQHCADKLLLVAEMLQAASEYLTVCHTLLAEEDPVMARLAYEHVLALKNQIAHLNKKADALESDLRRGLMNATPEKNEDLREQSPKQKGKLAARGSG